MGYFFKGVVIGSVRKTFLGFGLFCGFGLSSEVPDLQPWTVTATRSGGAVDRSVIFVQSFEAEGIARSPSVNVDDWLGRIPNFSLFRRTSSRAANPTTQGASLRGIGPSGTSRTLVLYDGVPFNDAFGGWISWNQIQAASFERIEVVRGGGSVAWGNTALGGVIQLVPRLPGQSTMETEFWLGNQGTESAALYASERFGEVGISVAARYFSTDGYRRVRAEQRGVVDVPSSSRYRWVEMTYDQNLSSTVQLTVRGSIFSEDRGNGTPLSKNATDAYRLHGKLEWTAQADHQWRADFYATDSEYSSSFSAVVADRSSERLVLDQYSVPSRAFGGSLQRSAPGFFDGRFTLGGDLRWVEGSTQEFVVFQGADRRAGGEQWLAGLFAEQEWEGDGPWTSLLGLRADYWRNEDGFLQQPNARKERFQDREELIFNARVGIARDMDPFPARIRAALYQAFRVPTINELYRPFQVGADQTLANAELNPERLIGGEFGIDWELREGANWRSTAYWNRVRDPILNVTIGQTGQGGQLRQRQNIEASEILGLENELNFLIEGGWRIFFAHAWTRARVDRAPEQPELTGKRLAQVPRHVLTAGLGLEPEGRGFGMEVQGRWGGNQFEDDQNTRELDSYVVFDSSFFYRFDPGRELFFAMENIFDRRFKDGITGDQLVTEGAPRFFRAGLRFSF